jgi:hypothetical protein
METNKYTHDLVLVAARELMISHGVFFAASLLADFGLPLDTALRTLCYEPNVIEPMDLALSLDPAFSAPNWTPIPRQTGHLVQRKPDTYSTANWTPSPA